MAAVGTVTKQSYEEIRITVDFSEVMATAESPSTATVTVTEKGSTTDLSSAMAGTATVSGDTVYALIKAGETGKTYVASFRCVTDGTPVQKFEADVLVKVKDVA